MTIRRSRLSSADWSEVQAAHTVDVISEHIADESELVQRLARSEIVVAMRERTPFSADVLDRASSFAAIGDDGDDQRLDRSRRRDTPRRSRLRRSRLRQRDARVDDRDHDRADSQLRPGGRRGSRRWLAAHDRAGIVRHDAGGGRSRTSRRARGDAGPGVRDDSDRVVAEPHAGPGRTAWRPCSRQARAVLDGGCDHNPHAVVRPRVAG